MNDSSESQLLAVLQTAAEFYQRCLRESQRAIDYLNGSAHVARLGVGYAPAEWRPLEAVVADYSAPVLATAGLVIDAPGGRRYDRFRDRIMFPIRNPQGRVIGFDSQLLDDEEPMYLSSPDSPVFQNRWRAVP